MPDCARDRSDGSRQHVGARICKWSYKECKILRWHTQISELAVYYHTTWNSNTRSGGHLTLTHVSAEVRPGVKGHVLMVKDHLRPQLSVYPLYPAQQLANSRDSSFTFCAHTKTVFRLNLMMRQLWLHAKTQPAVAKIFKTMFTSFPITS